MNWGADRLSWSSSEPFRWQRHVFSVVVATLVGVPLVLEYLGPAVKSGGGASDWLFSIVGGILVVYVLVSAIAALVGGPPPSLASKAVKDRWQIAWAVGLASLSILLMTHVVFVWLDNIRTEGSGSECADQVGSIDAPIDTTETTEPPDTTEPTETTEPPATTERIDSALSTEPSSTDAPDLAVEATGDTESPGETTPSETPETTIVDGSSSSATPINATGVGARPTETFGPQRQLQWHTFTVRVSATEDPAKQAKALAAIGCAAFLVVTDDDRPTSAFISSVSPLIEGQLAVRLNVDTSAIDVLDGGSYSVTAINTSDVPLEQNRIELDVVVQSRIVYYLLALLPPIVVAAMMQAFELWPSGLKRWFTSVVAVTAPAVTAFAAVGLRNERWGPTLFSVGAIIATTYTAAVTAATVVNKAGSGSQ